ncbi:hypothetical protein KGY63_03260, partial [Candidatus Bipolaricaulota bacterium]|nr:hypothetical protein [Candidatus Bipolaricaulota bacterium]
LTKFVSSSGCWVNSRLLGQRFCCSPAFFKPRPLGREIDYESSREVLVEKMKKKLVQERSIKKATGN